MNQKGGKAPCIGSLDAPPLVVQLGLRTPFAVSIRIEEGPTALPSSMLTLVVTNLTNSGGTPTAEAEGALPFG